MTMGDIEFIGTIKELVEATGLSESHLRKIVSGHVERRGTSIIEIGQTETKPCWRINDGLISQWDVVVAPFKRVEWIPKDSEVGKKLEVRK